MGLITGIGTGLISSSWIDVILTCFIYGFISWWHDRSFGNQDRFIKDYPNKKNPKLMYFFREYSVAVIFSLVVAAATYSIKNLF